jgi:xanthine dehydrogenase YagS FAD-binding subunit
LDEILDDDIAQSLQAVEHVIQGISSVQLQSQGTLVGELLRRPTCWYFRDGHGLLAGQGRRVVEGDNRFHAILGNRGPAKFVNASRLAPALVAAGAMVRVIGPSPDQEEFVEIERLYRSPETDDQTENTLQPGQLVTHVVIPPASGMRTASYEVRHGEGPDEPLASAAVALQFQGSRVTQARVVLGQVAPMPWVADQAARMLVGNSITEELAARAGIEATSGAMALSMNEYKIQLAQVAVKRALLRAVDLETGGLDCTMTSDPARETESVHLA